MDKERFIHSYQSLKFQENNKNVFNKAMIKRKCLAMNFFGSIQAGEDNNVTNILLEDDLKEYSKIVDDQDSENVNNYSDYILALLPQNQNENQKQWKTGLTESMLSEFLKPLSCVGSERLACKNSMISENQIEQFKQAQNKYSGQVVEKPFSKPNDFGENSRGATFKPIILRRNTPVNKLTESNFKINNEPSPAPGYNNKANDEQPQRPGFFKTARDELHVQNVKKYGKNAGNAGSSANSEGGYNYNYGSMKRSLGLGNRKGGVYNKFQPPVKREEGPPPPQEVPIENDEIIDERLKNIDPKMIELIKNEIMDCGSTITWDDIAGLDLAKSTIQEIVVWPMLRPDIFTGLRRPPKGILLFGPPGTGKTLIGKCIASQSRSTFFSISASSLTSKWVGDGEKMVRALFAVAKVNQPSVVFIDEIDSLLSQRSETEHESSRRIKTEFLVQLDGAGTGDEDRILIIGATNRPQELDEAARRRLVKRLYIPLPDETARKQMIRNLISNERHSLTEFEIEEIAQLTNGYSGADVKNLCQEASLGPIRSIPPMQIQNIDLNQVRPVNSSDFKSALTRIKSSVSENDLDTYIAWDRQYGCGSVH